MAIIQPSPDLELGLRQRALAKAAEAEIRTGVLPQHARLLERASDMLVRHAVDDSGQKQERTPWVLMPGDSAPTRHTTAVSYTLPASCHGNRSRECCRHTHCYRIRIRRPHAPRGRCAARVGFV